MRLNIFYILFNSLDGGKTMKKVKIEIPIRIGMLLANSRKCMDPNEITGGAGMALHDNSYMEIQLSGEAIINSSNKKVLENYCNYFKDFFEYTGEFEINTKRNIHPHIGYGSTITEITALCIGINKLFGNRLNDEELRRIINDYYCEVRENKLVRGYDSGLGALAFLKGGLVYTQNINSYVRHEWDNSYKVLLFENGLKNQNTIPESEFVECVLRPAEERDLKKKKDIIDTRLIPDILEGDYEKIGKDILSLHYIGSKRSECEQYGFEMQIRIIHGALENGASIAGLSSLGPLNYVVVLEANKEKLIQYLKLYHNIQNIREYEVCSKQIEAYYVDNNL